MPPAPELPGPRLALVVATAAYADFGFTQLRAPAQDASEMIGVLADPGIGGFTVTSVLNRPEYEIRRAVGTFLAGRGVGDLLVVYLSCHGVLDARGRLYFAATDTVKSRLSSTAVESTWLLNELEECRARRQVLILDCCFSGAFAQTKGGTEVDIERRLVGHGQGRAVLTASRAGEYSYEGTPLRGATTGRSVFTAALVDGLRSGEADRNGDGYISVEDAYAYAADQVKATGGMQSPQRWLYGAEGEIVLARNPHGVALTASALPEALRLSLESPYPKIRRGAVATLGEWLASTDPVQIQAAQQALRFVASQDSPAVAMAARNLLHRVNPSTRSAPASAAAYPARRPQQTRSTGDRLPPRTVSRRCLRVIQGKGLPALSVHAVAFSPDGRLLASGGSYIAVRLWDPTTGQPIGQPPLGPTESVRAVAFSPDGSLIASGGDTVRLWDPTTGRPLGQPLDHTNSVSAVAFSPDGSLIASGSNNDNTVRLWDIGQLWDPAIDQPVGQPLTGHTNSVSAVAFSPDGRLLASASGDKTVQLWDPATGQPIGQPLTGHTNSVSAVAFSPDGRLLASASGDKTVRLWDPATGQPIGQPLTGHTNSVSAVAFSPDGRLLASASIDSTIRLWGSDL